jgi:DNA-binding NarL/FixJ family response regulator
MSFEMDSDQLGKADLNNHALGTNLNHAGSTSVREDIEIAIIDDRPLMCDCFASSLELIEPAFRIQVYPTLEAFDAASREQTDRVSIVLLCVMWSNTQADYHISRIAHLKATRPSVGIVMLSDIENFDDILKAVESGTRGYIPTSVGLSVAAKAIQLVAAGGTYVPSSVLFHSGQTAKDGQAQAKQQPQSDNVFTSRQMSVIEALRRGKANKVIAYELNMCESTVKVHIRNVMKKLRARNRTEVAYILNTTPFDGIAMRN